MPATTDPTPTISGTGEPGAAVEVTVGGQVLTTTVAPGGTLTGTVKLEGNVPKPKGYNLTTLPDQFYCGRISDGQGWRILQPFQAGPAGEFREVVVYLEGIDKGKLSELAHAWWSDRLPPEWQPSSQPPRCG